MQQKSFPLHGVIDAFATTANRASSAFKVFLILPNPDVF